MIYIHNQSKANVTDHWVAFWTRYATETLRGASGAGASGSGSSGWCTSPILQKKNKPYYRLQNVASSKYESLHTSKCNETHVLEKNNMKLIHKQVSLFGHHHHRNLTRTLYSKKKLNVIECWMQKYSQVKLISWFKQSEAIKPRSFWHFVSEVGNWFPGRVHCHPLPPLDTCNERNLCLIFP